MADTAEEFQALMSRHAASFSLLFLLLFPVLHFSSPMLACRSLNIDSCTQPQPSCRGDTIEHPSGQQQQLKQCVYRLGCGPRDVIGFF